MPASWNHPRVISCARPRVPRPPAGRAAAGVGRKAQRFVGPGGFARRPLAQLRRRRGPSWARLFIDHSDCSARCECMCECMYVCNGGATPEPQLHRSHATYNLTTVPHGTGGSSSPNNAQTKRMPLGAVRGAEPSPSVRYTATSGFGLSFANRAQAGRKSVSPS